MRIAGDFSSFSFEPRGSVAFEGADRRGRLDSVVVRGGGSSVEGSEGDNFSKGSSLSRS